MHTALDNASGRIWALSVACLAISVAALVGGIGNALQYVSGGPVVQLWAAITNGVCCAAHVGLLWWLRRETDAAGRAMAWLAAGWVSVATMLETDAGVWLSLCFGCTYCAVLASLVTARPRTWQLASATLLPVLLLIRNALRPLPALADPVELIFCALSGGVATWAMSGWIAGVFHVLGAALTESRAARAQLSSVNHALATARDEALIASRAKDQFLANMSHELRTPLNAIIGYTEMLLENLDEAFSPEEAARDLSSIRSASRHLLDLVSTVLDLARIDAGTERATMASVPPSELLREVATAMRSLALARRNTIVVEDEALSTIGPIRTDPVLLRQVLVNLVGNAIKFTRDGCVTLAGEVDADTVRMVVRDTGVGIPADHLDRIFDRFVQVDASSTRRHEGLGLGLAISRSLVELMGGRLTVTSEVGRGSTFVVHLPRPAGQDPLR